MKGIIVFINHARGMYGVELSDGSCTIFELLDSNDIQLGDTIQGDLTALGGCTLRNLNQGEYFEVFIEDVGANLQAAKNRISSF